MNRGKPVGRRKPYRNPANVLYIISEGAKTEVMYLTEISRRFRDNLRYSLVIVPTPHTDPKGLVRDALEYSKKCTSGDEVWCFFDRDDNQDGYFKEAMSLAKDKIHIVFSNPCFELWYDLHFRYTTAQYNQKEMKHRIKTLIAGYTESMPVLQILCNTPDSLQDAIRNAKRLNDYHSGAGNDINLRSGNPSTQVFQILEKLDITQY
jgi:hypothetical protein